MNYMQLNGYRGREETVRKPKILRNIVIQKINLSLVSKKQKILIQRVKESCFLNYVATIWTENKF